MVFLRRSALPVSLTVTVACLTTLVVGSATADPSQSPPPGAARAAITAAYEQINTAFGQRDLEKVMSYFSPDYSVIDEKGVTGGKEEMRKQYEDQLRQIKTIRSRYAIQNLTPTAAGALVEMTMHSEGTGEKRILFAKFKGTFTDDLRVRDLWVTTAQGWRLKFRKTFQDDLRIHRG